MYNILTKNRISPAGLGVYDKNKYTCGDNLTSYDGIMVHSAPLHDMAFDPNLKAIVRVGAGVNTIPVDRCSETGVVVFNTPGGNANAVKELAISLMILSCRNVTAAMEWVTALKGKGSEPGKEVEKGKEVFRGPEIMGKRIGIIGLGAIGSRMARACTALGMTAIGYDPYLTPQTVDELRPYVTMVDNVKEIYQTCDFVTLHTPLTDETKDLIGEEAIEMMKPGVRIVNFARGPIINEAAIVKALKSGKVASFITDFPTDEQLGMDNVISTPHLGAGTPEADENCAVMAAKEMMAYLENGNITNSVNLPDVSMRRTAGHRVCIIHKNIPAMISGISQLFSDQRLNIEGLINKSRGDMAYTMVDVSGQVGDATVEAIKKIDGVIRVLIYR